MRRKERKAKKVADNIARMNNLDLEGNGKQKNLKDKATKSELDNGLDISLDDYDEDDGGLFGPADYRKLLKIQERAKMGQTAKSEATNWTTEKP